MIRRPLPSPRCGRDSYVVGQARCVEVVLIATSLGVKQRGWRVLNVMWKKGVAQKRGNGCFKIMVMECPAK